MVAGCSGGGGGNNNNLSGLGTPVPTTAPSSVATTTPVVTPKPTTSPLVGGGTPSASPSAVATSGFNQAAFTCPTSDTVSSRARSGSSAQTRRNVESRGREVALKPTVLEVTYATSSQTRATLAARESTFGAHVTRELSFSAIGRTTRIVDVGSGNVATIASVLRQQAGVLSVTVKASRRRFMTVTKPYYPNDPYFNGFTTTEAPTATSTAPPPTYHVAPYFESSGVPGQWNMHAIGLENAFAYSQAGNGSGVVNAGALGSTAVKLALIDTGADTTLPEFNGKFVGQGCFITNPNGQQSTGNFVTDQDGHGTDTAGIAASDTNNGLGFASAGGNVSLEEYRVDPTPDDACLDESTSGTDPQCSADVDDVATAINAAVASGANVISLSLGGGGCSNGVDDTSSEENALTNAFAKNVVVVASSGNDAVDTAGAIAAPACVTGVIAAGATGLGDGIPTGTGPVVTKGTSSTPVEYVATYSQYGTPGAAFRSSGAWGIVAPGGDPGNADTDPNGTVDELHWIEDVWTSTPLDSNYAGNCGPDYPGTGSQTADCRTLIAGTSMSAPTIAGAAAILISANAAYQSPTKMKQLLCGTADDLGDTKEGCGRLNVYRAMATAVGDATLP